jgi:hypothetical protein
MFVATKLRYVHLLGYKMAYLVQALRYKPGDLEVSMDFFIDFNLPSTL